VNKRKIINDPVYGFITVPTELIYDLIEHPYFQRLNRIRQLGLTYLVYPGAQHSRLSHALGAMHLMQQALEVLVQKGVDISNEEAEAVTICILTRYWSRSLPHARTPRHYQYESRRNHVADDAAVEQ
jgi:HD superfamily phosphohydrolase